MTLGIQLPPLSSSLTDCKLPRGPGENLGPVDHESLQVVSYANGDSPPPPLAGW
jgi:hypothetical protein